MSTDERWVPVPGWEGRYEVSTLGRVRSLWMRHGARRSPLLLRASPDRKGYLRVNLHGVGRPRHFSVHQLVALAFHGPRSEDMETRHLDGDSINNTPSNLAYGAKSQNRADSVRHGTHANARKTHCPQNHPYDDENTFRYSDGSRDCRACMRAKSHARAVRERLSRHARGLLVSR